MKVSESYIRGLIKNQLLLEARYQLKNLMEFKEVQYNNSNLFDAINETFISNGGNQHDLNNPKSAGRFFIDVLFDCMNEIKVEIEEGGNRIDVPDMILSTCTRLIFLYNNKETTSKSVKSGENFKDYILKFMMNYNKTSYPGASTVYEKLNYVFSEVNAKGHVSGLNALMQEKNVIKSDKETLYPFGKNEILEGYKVVVPLTTRSSVFWARTNWLGEEIVLPNQNDISWCTARLKDGNMFNYYSKGYGIRLFYFLPQDDIVGNKKFCIGIIKNRIAKKEMPGENDMQNLLADGKISDEEFEIWKYEHMNEDPDVWRYKLCVGGHTTVDFNNKQIIPGEPGQDDLPEISDPEVRRKLKSALKINDTIIDKLQKEMDSANPSDSDIATSLISSNQLELSLKKFNLNISEDDDDFYDEEEENEEILNNINKIIRASYSSLFEVKGLKIDQSVLDIIDENYLNWKKQILKNDDIPEYFYLSLYIPKEFRNDKDSFLKYLSKLIKFNIKKGTEMNAIDIYEFSKMYDVIQKCAPKEINKFEIASAAFCLTAAQVYGYESSEFHRLFNNTKSSEIINGFSDIEIDEIIENIMNFISIDKIAKVFLINKNNINVIELLKKIKKKRLINSSELKENINQNKLKTLVLSENNLRRLIKNIIFFS